MLRKCYLIKCSSLLVLLYKLFQMFSSNLDFLTCHLTRLGESQLYESSHHITKRQNKIKAILAGEGLSKGLNKDCI